MKAAFVAIVLTAAGVGLAPAPVGASEPEPVRYLDEVFTTVAATENLPYSEALDADGQPQTLVLDLYEAPANPDPARPVLLLLHGGGFTSGDENSGLIVRWARAMARRGYVVASIEYRTDDDESLVGLAASVERAIEDLRAAVRWLRANQATAGHAEQFPLSPSDQSVDLRIDPNRISAGGYSAGAVAVASASLREVLYPGRRDPASQDFAERVNPTNDEWPWGIAAAVPAAGFGLGGYDAGDPPLLMFHGSADPRVSYSSGTATCMKARDAGMDCVFFTFDDVTHALFADEEQEMLIRRETARFLSCRVGAEGAFTDLAPWIALGAGWAGRAGVVNGYPDGTFRAGLPVTRGQVVAMLWRLLDSPAATGPGHDFSDVPGWLEGPMDWAAETDVLTGYADGTVRPDLEVTRAQAARMVYRVAGAVDVGALPAHGLSDVPAWVQAAVTWLVAPRAAQLLDGGGMATGYGDATFRPDRSVSRGQVVRWLHGLALAGDAWDAARQDDPVPAACHRLHDPPP